MAAERETAGSSAEVSISVVSHRQGELARLLFTDLAANVKTPFEVVLTLNTAESRAFEPADAPFPLRVLRNPAPRGFGANHNAAFRESRGKYFCVLNPDIRIARDPFPALIDGLRDDSARVAAPAIFDPSGTPEDSARRFPTPGFILEKLFRATPRGDYPSGSAPTHPDWVAGMFMLFPRAAFEALGGFDERYYMYYEDVDLCARVQRAGGRVVYCPAASVVHHARRASRRSLRHFGWHLASMARYFLSAARQRLR